MSVDLSVTSEEAYLAVGRGAKMGGADEVLRGDHCELASIVLYEPCDAGGFKSVEKEGGVCAEGAGRAEWSNEASVVAGILVISKLERVCR